MHEEELNVELETDNEHITCVSHNSLLNCLFLITSDNKLILYDCNSKTKIKHLTLINNNNNINNTTNTKYDYFKIYNIQDKCIVASDHTLCCRLAHDGYFLLDTVFQTSFKSSLVQGPNVKTLELNAFDAKGLFNAFKQIESENVNGLDDIIAQLKQQLDQCNVSSTSDQWSTVCITDTYTNLLQMLTQSLDEIKRLNMQSVAIPTLSILLDRLYRLDFTLVETQLNNSIGVTFTNFDKRYMCSEATRRATFNQWPHMDYKWVLPDALAQAGFFHQPSHPGDDRTICFACDLCLVAWEQQDQPWSEHERHSPACQFVRGEITENVPLSVTASNQCAHKIFKIDDFTEKVTCTSEVSSERYFAVSNSTGHIVVYDCKDILKEMMHVQLINESQYNKEHKLQIHSLCFYYRNHKHVLYGAFTINNEVFIFSFNIFDIYRSYHSKSNKKSSKSHKNSTSVNIQTVNSTNNSNNKQNTTNITQTTSKPPLQIASSTPPPTINLDSNKINIELNKNILNSNNNEFTTYINDIVKSSIEEAAKLNDASSSVQTTQTLLPLPLPIAPLQPPPPPLIDSTLASLPDLTKTEKILNKLESITTKTQSTTTIQSITTNKSSIPSIQTINSSNLAITSSVSSSKPINSSNLSNFLVVRFETCANPDAATSTSSKTKNKYKKCIKIVSVSSKPLSYFDTNNTAQVNDIQLKTFEFTEKCLSFRLACLDFSPETRSNFNIKIINLYEKYLCAVVNFFKSEDQTSSFKLFKIKHEESNSLNSEQKAKSNEATTTTTPDTPGGLTSTSTNVTALSTSSIVTAATTPSIATAVTPSLPSNCLLATSSSRLNLTEFVLNCFTNGNLDQRILSILPITVTTFDDEDDLHFIALLNDAGVISIIDPVKNCIVKEFQSPSNDNKYVHMTYCYGIDKICAYTEKNKLYLISTRVFPIINQSILDESSDTIKLSEISLSKNLLVDGPLNSANLNKLHELIFFEQSKTNFNAKLPSAWTPILSDQNHQRKHPQHIHSETVNYTKSWRYVNKNLNNSINTDNQMENFTVEIFLNKPIQIGCIQLKLKFNKELTTPLELRLFKQKKHFTESTSTSSSTTSKLKSNELKYDFTSTDKYELLFGPCDLREFLDASQSKTYIITVSSDKILETRSNLLFLNFKFTDQDEKRLISQSSLSAPNYIQKIHITLKKYRRTGLENETIERGLMLVRRTFFINLLEFMIQSNTENDLLKILDILNWIFYNHFSIGSKVLKELMEIFEKYLDKFILIFYMRGNRSVSKKATMLINFLLNRNLDIDKAFGSILFDNLMHFFKYIPIFESSASLHWYFMLIHQVMNLDARKTFDLCMDMLIKFSHGHKYNYLYALLKMRYNLSCLLFENSLFDADLYLKFDITNQKLGQTTNQQQQQQTTTNPYSFSFGSVGINMNSNTNNINKNLSNQMSTTSSNTTSNNQMNKNSNSNSQTNGLFNTNSSIKDLNLLPQSMGLIEVLPLKYKYISSSNGTTIEKTSNLNNSNNSKQETPIYVLPDYFMYLDKNEDQQQQIDDVSTTTTSVSTNNQIDLSIFNSIFTFHPLQCLIVERMEPVSRHFVVIDFMFPVAITDIIIPQSNELASLSIDYWLVKEQKDSKRLCVSTTISQSPILLNDLQSPIICRYIKLIYVSQSTNTAKAKIPIGYFFGHPYLFYNDTQLNQDYQSLPNIFRQPSLWSNYINYLEKLLEENQCHYLMSIGKLRDLLNEIQFPSDNIGHLKMMQFNFNEISDFSSKIKSTYKECLDYQYKLNLNLKLIKRLKSIHDSDYNHHLMNQMNLNQKLENLIELMSQDKLRVTCGLLIKTLLCLTSQITNQEYTMSLQLNRFTENKIDLDKAIVLFRDLCIYGNYENECSLLLLRCCYNEPWWGKFISNCLKKFFVNQVKEVIPMSKAFITLNEMCLKSLNGSQTNNLFECLFSLVNEILQPLKNQNGCVEVTSLEWILLFISRLLMSLDINKDTQSRWEFLENSYSNLKLNSKPLLIRNKTKLKKKIFQTNKYFTWNKMKDSRRPIDKNRRHNNYFNKQENSFLNFNNDKLNNKMSLKRIHLPRDVSLEAGRSLAKLLISANSFCSSDLFVLSCRIISSLCCNIQPSVSFSEIINRDDLNQLILLNISAEFNHGSVSWGSPWSQHALLCLFMDIIENDKINFDLDSKLTDDSKQKDSSDFTTPLPPPPSQSTNSNLKIIEENEELTHENKETTKQLSNLFMNVQSLQNHFSNFFDQQKLNVLKKTTSTANNYFPFSKNTTNKLMPTEIQNLSISYDNRLDNSVFQTIESNLFINICLQNDAINKSVNEPLPSVLFPSLQANIAFNDQIKNIVDDKQTKSSISLIQETLEKIFTDLNVVNIENLLTFWLSLAMFDSELKYDTQIESLFYLNVNTSNYLLDYLLKYSFMNVKLWHLAFRMLSVVVSTSHKLSNSILNSFIQSESLYKFIYKFISTNEELVGDECCTSMSEFLLRLSDLITTQDMDKHFKKKLFEILCQCIDDSGCINRHQGPLDAQVVFIEYLINEDILICYDLEQINIVNTNEEFERMFMRYFDSLSKLVHYHICVYPRLSIKGVTSPRSCFSGVLTSLLFGSRSLKNNNSKNDKNKQDQEFSFGQQGNTFGFNSLSKMSQKANVNKFMPPPYPLHSSSGGSSSNKYSILCNRDNLMCLLLKMAINLITNFKSDLKLSSKVQKQVDLLEKVIFEETNLSQNGDQNLDQTQTNDVLMNQNNEFYDDDLLLQQLFLYELQQIDDNDQSLVDQQQTLQETESDYYEQEPLKAPLPPPLPPPPPPPPPLPIQDDFIEPPPLEPTNDEFTQLIQSSNSTLKSDKLIQLISNESLELFIESLGLCQSSALAMVISNSSYPIDLNLEDIQTPGDGLFLLLKYISSQPVKLVKPSFSYLNKIKRLSEPLLWFFQSLFINEDAVDSFINMGGVDIISKGFALTTRQLLYSGPCIVSSLMNLIDSDRQNIKIINNYDNESTEGFTNFASFGSIMCTNPVGNPVDVLLQNTATHRRIRSAIWSYHFQPNEHKVGLFITFPYTFLLKEIHVLPHTVSFGNCPAYVSLEVSRDGTFMTPIGPPIYTTGMLSIKLQLNKSELVNTIQINLYKSKDSQMIGLSQIRILGYPIFENMLSAKPDMMLTPVEDLVSRSNMGWLRLLYMFLTTVTSLEQFVCDNIQDNTIHLCIRLLSSPAMIIYDKIVETILLKLSKYNPKRGLEITKALLNAENGLESGIYSVPHGVLIETLINILYEISEINYDLDESTRNEIEKSRIDLILNWLNESYENRFNRNPSNMLLHCVACIIYKTKQDLSINEKYIESIIDYAFYLNDYYSKQSIDWILCSIFANKPQFLNVLIMKINLNDLFSNENKKRIESELETLSVALQSPKVIDLFLSSDFFKQLITFYLRLLNEQKIELNLLKVFASLAEFEIGQSWFGLDENCLVWQNLIHLLCYSNFESNNSEEICSLVIKMIKKMLFCNTNNQNKFSIYITKLIQDYVTANTSLNSGNNKISGFLHQLILQVFLDDQTLTVNFQRKSKVFKISCNSSLGLLTHPRYGTGYDCCCLDISLQKTAAEIINTITDVPIAQLLNNDSKTQQSQSSNTLLDMNSLLNNLKHYGESYDSNSNKKLKQSKSNEPVSVSQFPKVNLILKLPNSEEIILPHDLTLEKILGLYLMKTESKFISNLNLLIQLGVEENHEKLNLNQLQFDINQVPSSPLDEFVKCNGLTILAERLPVFMPFIHEPLLSITEKDRISASFEHISKTSPDFVDYVIMNESDEPFVDDIYNDMPLTTNGLNQSNKLKKINMPPYAFVAFGFFLKIPGYAKIILRDRKQAQSILKLLLGANKSKDDEFGLSLSTMPFESLRELLNEVKSNQEAKLTLTEFFTNNSILTLILSILSSISHHPHKKVQPHFMRKIVPDSSSVYSDVSNGGGGGNVNSSGGLKTNEEKNSNYWAKGTGFGTGSTIQQWDAEKTMMQQRMEEDHVACILEILSNFIECCCDNINEKIIEIFDDSCITNALSSYLRNDSVLDISRHIPLYKSVLKLVQAFTYQNELQMLISKCSIYELIKNMKQFVDTYIKKIKLTEEEGLSSLLTVLNSTFESVEKYLKPNEEITSNSEEANDAIESIDKKYCEILKEFQFDSYSIVSETENGTLKANIPYYYESSLNEPANFNNSNRAKRLAQETVTISNSLPISYSSTVFVRCDEERLDVMKVLITGPQDTPYANGCFEFDVFFPSDYPDSPPMINLQTTGNQTVRFNPNLYHDGKVCLSILNTWHGRPEERWNGQTSSFLQVLVSIQSLILVSEPYFNEPGYERSRGTPAGTASSIEHDANIRQATVRWAMLEALKKPPVCFKEPIKKHFLLKRKEIKQQCEKWLKELELHINDKQIGQSVSKSYISLKRHMNQLFEELDKLEKNENSNNES